MLTLGVLCGDPECVKCVKAYPVGDVKDHYDTLGTPVVGAGDGAESLLTRRVPLKPKHLYYI